MSALPALLALVAAAAGPSPASSSASSLAAPRPPGPGWFDSSHDLERGLEVREGWPADAPLGAWLDGFLRQPAPGGGAAPSSFSAR